MSRISTHVLDMSRGKPATGLAVQLERREGLAEWKPIASGETDADGRCAALVQQNEPLAPGVYRLTFDTGTYFQRQAAQGLYPVVQVIFEVRAGESHFHVPLLLSPNGYTTYRGS